MKEDKPKYYRGIIIKKMEKVSIQLIQIVDFETLRMLDARIVNSLKSIHGYHKDIEEIENFLAKQRIKNAWKALLLKQKLYRRQKGVCFFCGRTLNLNPNKTNLHIIPIYKGGDKSSMKNTQLLHKDCHFEHHLKYGI